VTGLRKLKIAAVVWSLLLAPVSSALAEGYFGVSAGNFEEDITEESDTALKIFAGVKLTPALALEISHIQLGEFAAGDPAFVSADIELSALTAALVGFVPLGPQSAVFAKFGLSRWEAEGEVCVFGTCETGDDSGTDPMFGVGLQLGLNRTTNLRIEYEKFEADDEDLGTLLSVGLSFDF
jgi:OmpA-OmpF porin, OOP family